MSKLAITDPADLAATKLNVDTNGTVWCLDGDRMPISLDVGVQQFLLEADSCDFSHIRLAGTRENAALIAALYEKQGASGTPERLEVCSPQICAIAARRRDPEMMLFDMRRNSDPYWKDSQGGWHDVTELDYQSYLLTAELKAADYIVNDAVLDVYSAHVLHAPLSFIKHLNVHKACELIATLIDPRWYVDRSDPDRINKLIRFLGLDVKTMTEVLEGNDAQNAHHRCRLVLDTWHTTDRPSNKTASFLWRAWLKGQDEVRSNLRASQMFIDYLFQNWMNGLLYKPLWRSSEPLFVPEHFFSSKQDVEDFRLHTQQFATVR